MRWFVVKIAWQKIVASMLFGMCAVLLCLVVQEKVEKIPATTVVGEAIRHGDETKPVIALACNVFWGEEYLPQMLATLAKEDVKITFFIGGTWAKDYPSLLQEIVAGGHELGNHTYSHPHPTQITTQKNQEQIQRAEDVIAEIVGVRTKLYAPPYGECDERVIHIASEMGYRTILWSVDTIDWQKPSPETIKQRVHRKVKNGSIILIHPTSSTAEALPSLLRELKEKGYTITGVGNLIGS